MKTMWTGVPRDILMTLDMTLSNLQCRQFGHLICQFLVVFQYWTCGHNTAQDVCLDPHLPSPDPGGATEGDIYCQDEAGVESQGEVT